MTGDGLVIVGASYAGVQIAASARAAGYGGSIRLIGDEPSLPYHKPPLSKGFLTGKVDRATLSLRAEAFYRNAGIDLVLGTRVAAIDRSSRHVRMATGANLRYDRLALAVGARPRSIATAGAGLDGVVALRSLADATALRLRLCEANSVVVIGGGFIGLEVAAALVALGKSVTVIEAQDRLLARSASAPLAEVLARIHRTNGVRLLLRSTVREIAGKAGRVCAVIATDDVAYPADLVIVGIGVVPDTGLADSCGLPCGNGIAVDDLARTADPHIVAAGDCTSHPSRHAGGMLRLESVQNAVDQAKTAGATIAGASVPYDAVPWFWSEQYDLKLQMVGLAEGYDRAVLRGSVEERRFSIFYFRSDALIAVDSVNRPADHMTGRKVLAAQARLTPAEAADAGFDLRSVLPR